MFQLAIPPIDFQSISYTDMVHSYPPNPVLYLFLCQNKACDRSTMWEVDTSTIPHRIHQYHNGHMITHVCSHHNTAHVFPFISYMNLLRCPMLPHLSLFIMFLSCSIMYVLLVLSGVFWLFCHAQFACIVFVRQPWYIYWCPDFRKAFVTEQRNIRNSLS